MKNRARALGLALLIAMGSFAVGQAAFAARTYQIAVAHRIAMFRTEAVAQAHCPSDVVVWLNTKTGIWHEKGMRWYGRTRYGAYVCRKEAAAARYRDTENGQ